MDNILPPLEHRHKEIKLGKPILEYFTIDLVVAFTIIFLLISLAIMLAFPYSLDFSHRNSYGIAKVYGSSMYPTIRNREYVLYITPENPNFNVSVGDIIVYYNKDVGVYVSHRVIDIYNSGGTTYLITKGDNNEYPDNPITINDVDAEVVKVIHNSYEEWFYEAWLNMFNWW